MTLRARVEAEVGRQWAEFEKAHPRLGEELAREEITTLALKRLYDDPEYARAVANGALADGVASVVVGLVEKAVKGVLGLVG
jgi:hypothetical protein